MPFPPLHRLQIAPEIGVLPPSAATELCISYAFVWPPNQRFLDDSEDGTRNSVAYYWQSMDTSMNRLVRRFIGGGSDDMGPASVTKRVRFVVHMHPACKFLIDARPLQTMSRGIVNFAFCLPTDDWRMPLLLRSTELLSLPTSEIVVQLDTHDVPGEQVETIETLLSDIFRLGRHAAFTFWRTDGTLQPESSMLQQVQYQGRTPVQYRVYSRSQADVLRQDPEEWFVDCGLAITTQSFRNELQIDFESFVRQTIASFQRRSVWDLRFSVDEALVDLALFKDPNRAPIVKAHAVIRAHSLEARAADSVVTEPRFPLQDVSSSLPRPDYSSSEPGPNGDRIFFIPPEYQYPGDALPSYLPDVMLVWGSAPQVAQSEVRDRGKRRIVLGGPSS